MFPLWQKVVLATGITVYCCLKDTYIQYIVNFLQESRILLSKLPNPDYYGRLGGACFDTLVQKMKKIKVEDQHKFLSFIFKYEFSVTKPTTDHKLSNKFLKHFFKLEQSFNKEKYISGNILAVYVDKNQDSTLFQRVQLKYKSTLIQPQKWYYEKA
jgi:hypothetical protein